jgi:hypothetical protein
MLTQPSSELRVEYRPLAQLIPFPRNARTHSKHQVRQIAESIKVFGFTNPVLIDERNTIIAGHGRVAAAQLLGFDSIPTIPLKHLSRDQVRTYILADNKLAENAGWDKEILAIELQHLTISSEILDITLTGFEIGEIDLIIQSVDNDGDGGDEPDIGIPVAPVTQLGDLWQLGIDAHDASAHGIGGNELGEREHERGRGHDGGAGQEHKHAGKREPAGEREAEVTRPNRTRIMRVRRPCPFIFSTAATESAPTTDPAPEQTSRRV